jgi:hypothetical protein
MDKQKLTEYAELLDDIAGNIIYNHRLNSGVVNLLRHSVDSNDNYDFVIVDTKDIDSCFSVVNNYNETIKKHLEELSDAIGKVYKLAYGDEMSDTDGWYSTEGDEHGEVPVAFQDGEGIEITSDPLWEEEYNILKGSAPGTTVTIRSREDGK